MHGNRGPEIIEDAVRLLLSPAGEILMSHGFNIDREWERYGKTVRYRYGYDWSQGMKEIMKKMDNHFNELYKLLEEIEKLKVQVEVRKLLIFGIIFSLTKVYRLTAIALLQVSS